MAFYSIGEVAERCGINPVTLRAWQRRYGLLKPQRSEGGHRQFDEEDILRIEEIKRWIERGVSVGKVKALLEDNLPAARDESAHLQEEMMSILRYMQPARIRAKLMALSHQHPIDTLIDSLLVPVRQRLKLDQNTSLVISSMLDGLLIDCVALFLAEARKKMAKRRCWWAGAMRTGRVCGWRHGVFPNAAGMSTFSPNRWSRRGLSYFPGSIFSSGPDVPPRLCRRSCSATGRSRASASIFTAKIKRPDPWCGSGLECWVTGESGSEDLNVSLRLILKKSVLPLQPSF